MKALIFENRIVDVATVEFPVHPTMVWVDCPDTCIAGAWLYVNNVCIAPEEPSYSSLRMTEYPPFVDYLDGVVKGDHEQIDKYIQECLRVKSKYPKP